MKKHTKKDRKSKRKREKYLEIPKIFLIKWSISYLLFKSRDNMVIGKKMKTQLLKDGIIPKRMLLDEC